MATKDSKTVETAENRKETVQEQTSGKGQSSQQESIYSASEFAVNAKEAFNTKPECVTTALKKAGITECTFAKAKEVVKKFLERKVE